MNDKKKGFIVIIVLVILLFVSFGTIHIAETMDVIFVQEPRREYNINGLNTTINIDLAELQSISSDYTPFSEYANINKKYIGRYDKYTNVVIYVHNYDIERYRHDRNVEIAQINSELIKYSDKRSLQADIATPNDIKYNWNTYIFTNKERTNHDDLVVNLPKVSGAWVGAYTYKNDNDIDVVSIDILYQSVENDQWVICIEMPVKNYNSDKVMRIVNELTPPQKGSGV